MSRIETIVNFFKFLNHLKLSLFISSLLLLFLCANCNRTKYSNPCDFNSAFFQRAFLSKIILGDKTPLCGIPTTTNNSNPNTSITPITSFTYTQSIYTMTQGVSISPIIPSLTGTITRCATTPSLPAGLIIDNATCTITGTPTVGTTLTDYSITATNALGSMSTNLKIRSLFGVGKFIYIPNFSSNNISIFSIDPNTGNLTTGGTVGFGTGTRDVAVDPSGKYLYAVGNSSNNIQLFLINNTTGALTASGSPLSTGTNPNSVTVDPTGKFVYVANGAGTISIYKADTATGLLTSINSIPSGTTTRWIRVDPYGKFAYAVNGGSNDIYIYSIDSASGNLTQVGSPLATGNDARSVTITPDGKYLYVANFNVNQVTPYSINQVTGTLTVGSFLTFANSPESVFVHPNGKYLYVAYTATGPLETVASNPINSLTGAISTGILATNGIVSPNRVFVDPSGKFAYSSSYNSNSITVYTIDPNSGNITLNTSYTPGTNPNSLFVTGANP
ncbi:MAG TPA: beta-propeller fold lactonase family protein [Leptospiraceae bacterium]|nr:beta-propeller fold lactonase family protein [Leptospiraceae bacterium]